MSHLTLLVSVAVLALLLAALITSARRARRIFRIRRDGGHMVAEGRIPRPLLGELREALDRAGQGPVIVSCYRDGDGCELTFEGELDPDQQQILRNLVGMWPVVRLMSAPRLPARRAR